MELRDASHGVWYGEPDVATGKFIGSVLFGERAEVDTEATVSANAIGEDLNVCWIRGVSEEKAIEVLNYVALANITEA